MKKQSKIYKTVKSLLTSASNRTDLTVCFNGIQYNIYSRNSSNGHETVKMQEVTMSSPYTKDIVINGNLLITDCRCELERVHTVQIQTEKIIYFFKGLPYPVFAPEWLSKAKLCYISIVDNYVDKVVRKQGEEFITATRFDSGIILPDRGICFSNFLKCVPIGYAEEGANAPDFLEFETPARMAGLTQEYVDGNIPVPQYVIAKGRWQDVESNKFLCLAEAAFIGNIRDTQPDNFKEVMIFKPGGRIETCNPEDGDEIWSIPENKIIGLFKESALAEYAFV